MEIKTKEEKIALLQSLQNDEDVNLVLKLISGQTKLELAQKLEKELLKEKEEEEKVVEPRGK